jgi:hypothetical protein
MEVEIQSRKIIRFIFEINKRRVSFSYLAGQIRYKTTQVRGMAIQKTNVVYGNPKTDKAAPMIQAERIFLVEFFIIHGAGSMR